MKRRKERLKLYMEAGLAVLLVVGLAAGGRAGLFEKAVNAAEELTQAAQGDAGTDAGTAEDGAENGAADASAGAEEAIADGQYPIMGSSSVTVQDMVDYFNASGETPARRTRRKRCPRAGRTPSRRSARCIMTRHAQKAYARKLHSHRQ